jgi:transcription initiation factor TFIIB
MYSKEIAECPHCKSNRLFHSYDRGEITCSECGTVIVVKNLDQGPDWRAFSTEELKKKRRTGPIHKSIIVNPSLVSSTFDLNKDALGKNLPPKEKYNMLRLMRWQKASLGLLTERSLINAMEELDRLVNQMGLPNIVKDEALLIFRKCRDKGLVKGRPIKGVVAAALYFACRRLKIPISLDEISNQTNIPRKIIAKHFRHLVQNTDIDIPIIDPIDYLDKFIGKLKLDPSIYSKAKQLIIKAKERGITIGKEPSSITAAAIYIASFLDGKKITQKEIARVANLTEVTVRNRIEEMVKKLNIEGIEIRGKKY